MRIGKNNFVGFYQAVQQEVLSYFLCVITRKVLRVNMVNGSHGRSLRVARYCIGIVIAKKSGRRRIGVKWGQKNSLPVETERPLTIACHVK
jgi:hypothetical protein